LNQQHAKVQSPANRATLGRMKSRRPTFLAAAFVGLLLVIGAATLAVGRSARIAQDRVTALNQARMQSDDALDTIRANVYLLGIVTRDYLLDTDAAGMHQYATQFNAIRSETEKSFQTLALSKDADLPQEALNQLRAEFGAYADVTALVLGWSAEQKRALGPAAPPAGGVRAYRTSGTAGDR
jgi:hypothetical protein